MTDNPSVQDEPIVAHDRVTDVIRAQLNVAINVQRRFTVESLAAQSGVSVSAIRSYMRNDGAKVPSLDRALSLAVVLGKRAVNALLNLIGYSAAPLDEPEPSCPMRIVAEGMGHIATIAKAASDGRIDHTEEPETTQAADMLIATVLPLSSAGKAA